MPIIPEGGIPTQLVIRPTTGEALVIHADMADVVIYRAPEWDANGSSATPIASLSREEITTLAGFVRYWLDDDTEGFRFASETPNISFRK